MQLFGYARFYGIGPAARTTAPGQTGSLPLPWGGIYPLSGDLLLLHVLQAVQHDGHQNDDAGEDKLQVGV